jgi:hypothetical protein
MRMFRKIFGVERESSTLMGGFLMLGLLNGDGSVKTARECFEGLMNNSKMSKGEKAHFELGGMTALKGHGYKCKKCGSGLEGVDKLMFCYRCGGKVH